MAELTAQNVGAIVRQISDLFITRTGESTGVWCDKTKNPVMADKVGLTRVVKRLSDYTDEVQQSAAEGAGGLAGLWLDVFGGGGSPGQWTLDMSRWRERLAAYQYALDHAAHETGTESCTELKDTVAMPLLLGWYLPGTPGIANPEIQSVPDVATPYILGNGIKTHHDFAVENFERFVQDVKSEVKRLLKRGLGILGKLAIAVGVGAGAVLTYKLVAAEKKR